MLSKEILLTFVTHLRRNMTTTSTPSSPPPKMVPLALGQWSPGAGASFAYLQDLQAKGFIVQLLTNSPLSHPLFDHESVKGAIAIPPQSEEQAAKDLAAKHAYDMG
jgi:hypothetical protein